MPVNSRRKDYEANIHKWRRGRDCYEGSDAVKHASEAYLPRLASHRVGQDTERKYAEYKMRALFYNAVGRTVDGLSGGVFQKAPVFDVPPSIKPVLEDVTLAGQTAELFCLEVTREVLKTGRYGVLVDMPDAEATELRPYWVGYRPENIISWRSAKVDGDDQLMLVVLCEFVEEVNAKDAFITDVIEQYRVLELKEGAYVQSVWREQEENGRKEWVVTKTVTPMRRGEPLDFIPFVFFGPTTVTPDIEKPPLDDLTEVNLSHYRASADLKHGLHWAALPTPWVSGLAGEETGTLEIGSSKAWVLAENGRAGMLEVGGPGFGAISADMEDMKKMMATLGARLLEEQSGQPETMGGIGMRHAGEHASLRTVTQAVEQGITMCLQWSDWWSGTAKLPEDSTANAELNKDFFAMKMSTAELKDWIFALQSGSLSYETFYTAVTLGGLTRPDVTSEEEQEQIKKEDAMKPDPQLPDPNADPNDPNAEPPDPNDPNADPNAPPVDPKAKGKPAPPKPPFQKKPGPPQPKVK